MMENQSQKAWFGVILWIFCKINICYSFGKYGIGNPNPYTALSGYKPMSELLEQMFNNYERRIRPFHKSSAVEIQLSTFIVDLLFVDEWNEELTIDFFLRQYWIDPRLTFVPKPNVGHAIHLDMEYSKRIWKPDTFVFNERKMAFHSDTITEEWIQIKSDGEVRQTDRRKTTVRCPMTFYYYPFDRHTCSLEFENLSSPIEDVQYDWYGGTVAAGGIAINATNGTIVPFRVVKLESNAGSILLASGNFSRLSVNITIQKYWGVYFAKFYVPLFLFVVVALVTLWIRHIKFSSFINLVNLIFAHIFLLIPDTGANVPYTEYWKANNIYLLITLMYLYVAFLVSLALYVCNKYEVQCFEYKAPKTYVRIAKELHPDDKLKRESLSDETTERSPRSIKDIGTQTYFATAISKVLKSCRIIKWALCISYVVVNLLFWLFIIFLSGSYLIPHDVVMMDHDLK